MKHNIVTASIAALVLALALGGCSSSSVASSSASSEEIEVVSEPSVSAAAASEEAAVSGESTSATASTSARWVLTNDANAAAAGAGLAGFALPKDEVKLSIGTVKPADWKFRFTDGIAEADGYAGAATVVVREGSKAGDCSMPLSDFIAGEWPALEGVEYAEVWTQSVGDTETTCFGNTKGVASKMIWNADQSGFSVQVLGQGDNWANFGIEEDDIKALVGAVIEANSSSDANAKSKESDKSSASAADNDMPNAKDYVEALVWQNGLGELVSYKNYKDDNGNWMLEVVTRGADGNEYTSVLGADGSVLETDYVQPEADDGEEAAAETDDGEDGTDDSDGEADDGADADADANDDSDSDDSDDDSGVKKYSNKEAKQAVEDYDLGTYMYSQEIESTDGTMYQEITTRDEDGNDSYSYLDSDGNVVYDVDVDKRYNNDGSYTTNKKS